MVKCSGYIYKMLQVTWLLLALPCIVLWCTVLLWVALPCFTFSKTSFDKNCFSAWASTLNMGLINKG